jgi:UPF0716 protein FxsA
MLTIDDPGRNANHVLVKPGFGPMPVVKWTLIGVLLLPAAEIVVFVLVALWIGWFVTAVLCLATSAAGVIVLKRASHAEVGRLRAALAPSGAPAAAADNARIGTVVGGILLALPGFITDLMGALLLIPAVRRWTGTTIRRALDNRRARQQPAVVNLAPDEWRQVPEATLEDRHSDKSQS